jgi:hypothetical protein
MPVGAQDDTDPIGRQCNLESSEENIILKFLVVRCGKILSRARRGDPTMQASSAVSAFPNGEGIALGCRRPGNIRKELVGTRHAEAQS